MYFTSLSSLFSFHGTCPLEVGQKFSYSKDHFYRIAKSQNLSIIQVMQLATEYNFILELKPGDGDGANFTHCLKYHNIINGTPVLFNSKLLNHNASSCVNAFLLNKLLPDVLAFVVNTANIPVRLYHRRKADNTTFRLKELFLLISYFNAKAFIGSNFVVID